MLKTIHNDFMSASDQFPDKTAIWTENGAISYSELDQRSSALAQWLLDSNFAPRERTAIILPKSVEAVIAILATLKAGNAYVPLGDNWSQGRLDKIIQNGDFRLVITNKDTCASASSASHFLHTDSEDWALALQADIAIESPTQKLSPDSTAYILYTSGSTGIPKGVCVSHRAAAYFPQWAAEEFKLSAVDRIASVAPFSFDLSTFDLFSGLAAGATIYLVPEKYKLLPARFSKFLQDHQITTMYAVPSLLGLLVHRGKLDKRDLECIKTILFAGEVFPTPLFQQFRELMPKSVQYFNLYGPTETNVCSYYQVPDNFNDVSMPIGLALPGTHFFLRQQEEVQESNSRVSGELCVAGPAVMSGYWGQSDEDANYWEKDPTGVEPHAYCTGDIVSQDITGNWLYHGRRDKMVKIQGYRVEIGEIESCLLGHENTDLAAVVKRTNNDNVGDELVAFIVQQDTGSDFAVDSKAIYQHCKNHLPPYMIPRKLYSLSNMPLNNSGKIDRLALEKKAIEKKTAESLGN